MTNIITANVNSNNNMVI